MPETRCQKPILWQSRFSPSVNFRPPSHGGTAGLRAISAPITFNAFFEQIITSCLLASNLDFNAAIPKPVS